MNSFFKDYETLNPKKDPASADPKAADPKAAADPKSADLNAKIASESFEDMKAYMDAMKENILKEVKDEISKLTPAQNPGSSGGEDDKTEPEDTGKAKEE